MIGFLLTSLPNLIAQIILLLVSSIGAGLLPAVLETTTAPLEAAVM